MGNGGIEDVARAWEKRRDVTRRNVTRRDVPRGGEIGRGKILITGSKNS
jgi:hypothetical protein